MIDATNPRWLREMSLVLSSCPQMILTGNVRDYHQIGDDLRKTYIDNGGVPRNLNRQTTIDCLKTLLTQEGIPVILLYDPVDGLRSIGTAPQDEVLDILQRHSPDLQGNLNKALKGELSDNKEYQKLLKHVLRVAVEEQNTADSPVRMAVILDFASWVAPVNGDTRTGSDSSTELPSFLRQAAKMTSTAKPIEVKEGFFYNPIVWVTRQQADLPNWLVTAPGMRLISIELPTSQARAEYGSNLLVDWPGWRTMSEDDHETLIRQFASATEGLMLRDGANIVNLARNLPSRPGWSPPDHLRAAERVFRIGVADSQWDDPNLITYLTEDPNCQKRLDSIVSGQPKATQKAASVLMRSVMGLSGSETAGANPNRPKGVLFLAGPSGTGKTLLAKSISGLLNQDPSNYDSYIRFDMSEYSAEHTDARLVGAPPGYVGYDAGGQLTEAVRQRPFSVLLFDEIEKAHPRILDKFLQILDEGRLTDGTGMTVSFSETFIVFTSNLGVIDMKRNEYGQVVAVTNVPYAQWAEENAENPGSGYADLENQALTIIDHYFTSTIQRPELLNRIGKNNIVIFDYIGLDVAKPIVDNAISGVMDRMLERHGCTLQISNVAREQIDQAVMIPKYLEMGGRGLNSGVEDILVNPLAGALAQFASSAGGKVPSVVTIASVTPTIVLE